MWRSSRIRKEDVTALGEIADQLGKKDWNFKVDPCTGNDQSWTTTTQSVGSYWYTSTSSSKATPPEDYHLKIDLSFFVQFPLACSDLIANYLSGNIPQEWASMQLEFLSISTNNLSGPIPTYLGNITTLKIMYALVVSFFLTNCLDSKIISLENREQLVFWICSPKLGNLVNLELLSFPFGDCSILSANNLTGELPATLINLTKLIELCSNSNFGIFIESRISSNNFTGRVPDFFQTWKQLKVSGAISICLSCFVNREIQASGPEGPIPPSISALSTLTELDLSFNRLKGNVPDLGGLARLNLM
ncbi:putative leucine-rich repeat receptor-like serine/threonine-protein kinase [Quercus suber]|uniref:Leucine-rich repeat receptor-like serine/threonine-protein kinase n=1 Tax=Quercus suber TaxID=58331 RepID=A0AAW0LC44_QUESU